MLRCMLYTNIAVFIIKRHPEKALKHSNRRAGQLALRTGSRAELIDRMGICRPACAKSDSAYVSLLAPLSAF